YHENEERTTKNSNSVTKPSTESDQAYLPDLQRCISVTRHACPQAVLEVVVATAMVHRDPTTCLVIADSRTEEYVAPDKSLLFQLRKKYPALRSGSDKTCDSAAPSRSVVGSGQLLNSRTAHVLAGDFSSQSGRPTYVVKKNWLGRWRVTGIRAAE
ncbi:MAG: hypothetical protein K2Y23_14190, partial [Cyanobacteria bacterium]|nr:hypothetical protein [Cyanobacteriota bacterium]